MYALWPMESRMIYGAIKVLTLGESNNYETIQLAHELHY